MQCGAQLRQAYRHSIAGLSEALTHRFPRLTIEARTVHAAKGLEADFVIVLDLGCGRYGFPSEVADDPLLGLVLTDTQSHPHAEERRLFYVALTRARRRVYLVADDGSPSPFVTELMDPAYAPFVEAASTGYAPAPCTACGGRLVRRTGKFGPFWGCSNYPYCRAKGTPCRFCGGTLIRRDDRFVCNREGCSYDAQVCPRCRQGGLTIKRGRFGRFWGCTTYPACDYTRNVAKDRRGRNPG